MAGKKVKDIENKDVLKKFQSYPNNVRKKLLYLRQLIFEAASENKELANVEETLKWGEPSYLTDGGSAVRIGWKKIVLRTMRCIFIVKRN